MAPKQAVLAIDQGTTNSKAILVDESGTVLATGSTPVNLSLPRPGWAEQDAEELWSSVVTAVERCRAAAGTTDVVAVALTNQRESVVGWRRSTGRPFGPLIGWQDIRTSAWCERLPAGIGDLARDRTGLRVDAMFSAPKINWLLSTAAATPAADICVGTVDSWLIWCLTGHRRHVTEAGNAGRTLLYDVIDLEWSDPLLDAFDVPRGRLPKVVASNGDFGTTVGVPGVPDGTPIAAVLADSHAALYGQGCTEVGMAKATYGTGSSLMTPIHQFDPGQSPVPTTLAWLTDRPVYAREGNIVSSGAALAWTGSMLGLGIVAELVDLAGTVPDAGDVTLVPAFSGLCAPHWDRNARAAFTGMSSSTTRAHLARAAVDAVAHQVCDIADAIEGTDPPLSVLRADGGAVVAGLLMQTQADLLAHPVEVADVAELSALGAAQLAWQSLGSTTSWAEQRIPARIFTSTLDDETRRRRREHWADEVAAVRARKR
ncbi:FGGY family carbohydrate kinase [Actinopolymorpha sp. B17G11]|uniref:FGGY family carbohydrate kinase n=1 Tax=Actinopolymorpha sp. B17G11 TaxID=3160861 RepID=UPI0032E47AAC